MLKKDVITQPTRATPSKSMLSQIQSRIAQSRLKSRLTISRNTPDNLDDERFLYKSLSKKDQKKIEPIANTYSLPVPKIKLLILNNKKNKDLKIHASEFLNSEQTTFDDFKNYRLFNGPEVSAKKYSAIKTPDPKFANVKTVKQSNQDDFFFSRTDSYINKQDSFEKDDSFIRVVQSPSFLSGKSSFVSFIPYDDDLMKKGKTISKPILTKNHTISNIQLNKLKIYDEPYIYEENDKEDSFLFHESMVKDDSFLKQDSFDKYDSFIQVVKSPSFLSGQSSFYSLLSMDNPKNKFSISQVNSNKFDQYLKKYCINSYRR